MATTAVQPARRRQRSARVVTAVALVVLGAVAVLAAILSSSWVVLLLAAVTAVALGATATKITHTELSDTRRAAARDRADLARDYHDLQVLRGAENEQFAEAMRSRLTAQQRRLMDQQDRITELDKELVESRSELAEAQSELAEATERAETAEGESARIGKLLEDAKERAAHAEMRIVELEQQVQELTADWAVGEVRRKRA